MIEYIELNWSSKNIEELVGETITNIQGLEEESECVQFLTEGGDEYRLLHMPDCCESVLLIDFENDIPDGDKAKVLSAEVVTNENEGQPPTQEYSGSYTWLFYKIETDKGGLWMRWLGESNGYYGEEAVFIKIQKQAEG